MSNINVIEGGICAVEGVRAAGSREGKYGLTVIESKDSAASADVPWHRALHRS